MDSLEEGRTRCVGRRNAISLSSSQLTPAMFHRTTGKVHRESFVDFHFKASVSFKYFFTIIVFINVCLRIVYQSFICFLFLSFIFRTQLQNLLCESPKESDMLVNAHTGGKE